MNVKAALTSSLLIALVATSSSQVAHAGDVSGATLACFVDTNALDPYKTPVCRSIYRGPGYGSDPSIASFAVQGLPAGSYSFTWVDLETGQAPNCGSTQSNCTVPIGTDVYGDGYAELAVTVRDLSTGASKTVSARALYIDGYH